MMRMGTILAAAALGLAALLGVQAASAQYPQPIGGITAAVGSVTVTSGGSTQVSCTVRDASGNALSGRTITFTISSQPGSSATLSTQIATTNSAGTASVTLSVGSAAGTIIITCSGESLSARVTTEVLGIQATAVPPAAAPAIRPPATGDGGLVPQDGSSSLVLSLGLSLVSVLIIARVAARTR